MGKREWIVLGVAAVALVVLIVVLVVSCGGSSDNSSSGTTTTQSSEQWANGLCTATNTYVASLKSLGTSLKGGNLSKDSLNGVVDDAKTATDTFVNDVKAIGAPPVADSGAKSIFDTLSSELSKDADAIKSATSGGGSTVTVLTTVATTLASAGTQISAAYSQLKTLDPKGDIQQAFQSAPACASLLGS